MARLVEVISGQTFDKFIKARIFDPLGMVDTGFVVPEKDQGRLVAYYAGADLMEPMKPGLTRTDNAPFPGAYLRPIARLNGGGGLVSTLPDMVALIRSLLPGGKTLLKPETIAQMMTNQLPDGQWIRFALMGEQPGKAYGARRRVDPEALGRSIIPTRQANSIGAASPARNGGFRRSRTWPA